MLVDMIKNEISQKEGKTRHCVQCNLQLYQTFMATQHSCRVDSIGENQTVSSASPDGA
jgi:hypothetical protein